MAEVIVALDQPTGREALSLVDRLPGLRWVKVGSTLFVREGPAIVTELVGRGLRVFLDLKWHDIPHQVAGAVRSAADLGVSLATVHGTGGRAMLEAAAEAARLAREGMGGIRLVAVSVLTSHDSRSYGDAVGRDTPDLGEEVVRLARIAVAAGMNGMVASPLEARAVRAIVGDDGWVVVPGVRPPGAQAHDQRRTATPEEVVAAGATHIVVGRPVAGADNPWAVYQKLCQSAASGR